MKNFLYILTTAAVLWSCRSEDELGDSVIQDSTETETVMDKWLYENYTKPYNIQVYYKLRDIDTDADDYVFNIVPADAAKSFALAQVIKYFWAGTFEEYLNAEFIKTHGFREMQFEGTYRYKTSSHTKATASAGIRIVFCGVNYLDMSSIKDADAMIDNFIHTMFHENTHILNQKKPYPDTFSNVSGSDYIGDDWQTRSGRNDVDTAAWKLGFITAYSGHSAGEDFAEIFSIYVTQPERWETALAWVSPNFGNGGGIAAVETFETKLGMVRDYMLDAWNIDIDAIRDLFQERAKRFNEIELINY